MKEIINYLKDKYLFGVVCELDGDELKEFNKYYTAFQMLDDEEKAILAFLFIYKDGNYLMCAETFGYSVATIYRKRNSALLRMCSMMGVKP